MPSRKKTLMFASAFFTSIWSFVIICLVLASKNWVSSNVNFTEGNSSAIVTVTYGVFEGVCSKKVIGGLETPATNFQVTAKLGKAEMRSLNIVIILFLVLSLLSSLISAGFTCCNTVSNPYQTFLGPIGVYTWNSLSGIFILLTMILFAANIEANQLSVELASNCVFSSSSQYQNSKNSYGYAYWLMFLILLLNVATIIIIVFYHRARYSKRKEQERPIENAPKDGILF